jgi:hypothetical protein
MDLDLVGYLWGLVDPAERERIEAALRADPAARARLERLKAGLAPLEIASDDGPPPVQLADRTMARVRAARPTPSRLLPHDEPVFAPAYWRRIDAAVAACILLVVGGLGISGAGRLHQRHLNAVCQDNLRQLHQAFVGYSDGHGGRFPQVADRPPNNMAAAFVPMLQEAGRLPPTGAPPCPTVVVAGPAPATGGYAYSLGFRGPDGRLYGLRQDAGQDADLVPMLADRFLPAGHRTGHNVLFIGGNVRFCTTPNVGADGDDIFMNQANTIAAGLHRMDTVLADGNTPP